MSSLSANSVSARLRICTNTLPTQKRLVFHSYDNGLAAIQVARLVFPLFPSPILGLTLLVSVLARISSYRLAALHTVSTHPKRLRIVNTTARRHSLSGQQKELGSVFYSASYTVNSFAIAHTTLTAFPFTLLHSRITRHHAHPVSVPFAASYLHYLTPIEFPFPIHFHPLSFASFE